MFKNLCAVNATEGDASLSKLSYLTGGLVGSACLIIHTLRANEINTPLVFLWATYLCYHLGPNMFKQWIDLLAKRLP